MSNNILRIHAATTSPGSEIVAEVKRDGSEWSARLSKAEQQK